MSKMINREVVQENYQTVTEILEASPENDFAMGQQHALALVLNGFYLKDGTDELDEEKIQRQCKGLEENIRVLETLEMESDGADYMRGELQSLQDVQDVYYLKTEVGQEKYAIFSIPEGEAGFLDRKGKPQENGIEGNTALFTDQTAKEAGIDITDESKYIRIPISQAMLDQMPFSIDDTMPGIENATKDQSARDLIAANPEMDFVVLSEYGFYDEKYNSSTNTSRPKVRSFDLDYANLYNKNTLREDWILDPMDKVNPMIIPISETQQQALQNNSDFTQDFGFFFEPIGDSQKTPENLMDLDKALTELESNDLPKDLPFEM